MKLIKSRNRSVLKNDMLEALMMALINGPPINDKGAHTMLEKAVRKWLEAPRRKLPPSTGISTLRSGKQSSAAAGHSSECGQENIATVREISEVLGLSDDEVEEEGLSDHDDDDELQDDFLCHLEFANF
jgi:hypothetical protein